MSELSDTDKKKLKPVFQKMAHFCAFQERALTDVLQKLKKFSLPSEEQQYIVHRLSSEGFLDENRYVSAFINDKFRLNRWGPVKIAHALKAKQVSSQAIAEGLLQIKREALEETLLELATKKVEALQNQPPLAKKQKLVNYLLQKGFDPDMIWSIANRFS